MTTHMLPHLQTAEALPMQTFLRLLTKMYQSIWATILESFLGTYKQLSGLQCALSRADDLILSQVPHTKGRTKPVISPKISQGRNAHGRCLVATTNIQRGEKNLLIEQPVYKVPSLPTAAPGEQSLLLPEHLIMGIYIARTATSAEYDTLLSTLQSQLTEWSLEQRTYLSSTAILWTLLTHESPDTAPIAIERLFQILTRLPTNTHGISSVCSMEETGEMMVEVQQHRAAYGLFLVASAINHSCDPNCLLCHDRDPATGNYFLRLAPTRFISSGEELTTSYGPLDASMRYQERQTSLRTQYLFVCRCSSCCRDQERLRLDRSPQIASNAHLYTQFTRLSDMILRHIATAKAASETALESITVFLLKVEAVIAQLKPHAHYYTAMWMLRDMHRLQCQALDLQCRFLVFCGAYSKAAEALQEAMGIMVSSGLYAADSVEVAREKLKLVQIMLWTEGCSAQYPVINATLKEVHNNLEPFVSISDTDLVECELLLRRSWSGQSISSYSRQCS